MRAPALIAAHQAADATAALLLHADEGHFGELDVPEKLAEALALTIDLRLREVETCDLDYRAALEDLRDRCKAFIEGWAG